MLTMDVLCWRLSIKSAAILPDIEIRRLQEAKAHPAAAPQVPGCRRPRWRTRSTETWMVLAGSAQSPARTYAPQFDQQPCSFCTTAAAPADRLAWDACSRWECAARLGLIEFVTLWWMHSTVSGRSPARRCINESQIRLTLLRTAHTAASAAASSSLHCMCCTTTLCWAEYIAAKSAQPRLPCQDTFRAPGKPMTACTVPASVPMSVDATTVYNHPAAVESRPSRGFNPGHRHTSQTV